MDYVKIFFENCDFIDILKKDINICTKFIENNLCTEINIYNFNPKRYYTSFFNEDFFMCNCEDITDIELYKDGKLFISKPVFWTSDSSNEINHGQTNDASNDMLDISILEDFGNYNECMEDLEEWRRKVGEFFGVER